MEKWNTAMSSGVSVQKKNGAARPVVFAGVVARYQKRT
jgi:hypothetical protein